MEKRSVNEILIMFFTLDVEGTARNNSELHKIM